mgnify:CR=1 FL=1
MVRNLSVDIALEEISRIESLIKPYEYQVYEARETLRFLSDLRESLNRMDKEKLADALKNLRNIESRAMPYRGFDIVERALQHAKKLEEELKKILES